MGAQVELKSYARKMGALTGISVLLMFMPLLVDALLGAGSVPVSAAYAKDGGDGGGDGGDSDGGGGDSDGGGGDSDGGGHGGDSDGDSGGNSGRGGGSRGDRDDGGHSSSGHSGGGRSGKDRGGHDAKRILKGQKGPDVIIRHLNGWVEGIISGTYVVRDGKNRTVIRRSATQADIDRMDPSRDP